MWEVVCADVLEWCENYAGPLFHAILTDPPYALNFMNKAWDNNIAFKPETWAALAEHLLPGGFVMAFASSRGWHRLACAIENAGLIIQPSIFGWLNGQSFPKATRIDTQIDKAAGIEREVIGQASDGSGRRNIKNAEVGYRPNPYGDGTTYDITTPATDLARAWEGHRYGGQILKNALEPIIVAQKPWEGKRLDCIVETGAGALWVDGGRVGLQQGDQKSEGGRCKANNGGDKIYSGYKLTGVPQNDSQGRWPANFVLCHSEGCERVGVKRVKGSSQTPDTLGKRPSGFVGVGADKGSHHPNAKGYADPDGMETVDDFRCSKNCPVARLDEQAGERPMTGRPSNKAGPGGYSAEFGGARDSNKYMDSGGPSRFYHNADWSHEVAERIAGADPVHYMPKAAKRERNQNLDDFYWRKDKAAPIGFIRIDKDEWEELGEEEERIHKETGKRVSLRAQGNIHPTCKPISLNKWLATLLLPPKEYAPCRILIPFSGSGSEMIAAGLAGWEEVIGIDFEQDYCDIAEARLKHWLNSPKQLELP